MLTDGQLIQWIEHFGRWNVQELVAKRQDTRDVIAYLRAERSLELARVMEFVTSDSVLFEREEASYLSLRQLDLSAQDGLRQNAHLLIEEREL